MTAVELPGVDTIPHPPDDHLVLDVRDLRMRYGSVDVLHGVTFTARRGEVLALLGPNGAGKTHHHRDPRRLPDALGR